MARRCSVTSKAVMTGNNVSHANNKSRRRFLPNLQSKRLMSDVLGQMIRLRISTHGLRTIEARGGLDAFLMGADVSRLDDKMVALKRRVESRAAAKAAVA